MQSLDQGHQRRAEAVHDCDLDARPVQEIALAALGAISLVLHLDRWFGDARKQDVKNGDEEVGLHGHHLQPEKYSEHLLLVCHLVNKRLVVAGRVDEILVDFNVHENLVHDAENDKDGRVFVIIEVQVRYYGEQGPRNRKLYENTLSGICLFLVEISIRLSVLWWRSITEKHGPECKLDHEIA